MSEKAQNLPVPPPAAAAPTFPATGLFGYTSEAQLFAAFDRRKKSVQRRVQAGR